MLEVTFIFVEIFIDLKTTFNFSIKLYSSSIMLDCCSLTPEAFYPNLPQKDS